MPKIRSLYPYWSNSQCQWSQSSHRWSVSIRPYLQSGLTPGWMVAVQYYTSSSSTAMLNVPLTGHLYPTMFSQQREYTTFWILFLLQSTNFEWLLTTMQDPQWWSTTSQLSQLKEVRVVVLCLVTQVCKDHTYAASFCTALWNIYYFFLHTSLKVE